MNGCGSYYGDTFGVSLQNQSQFTTHINLAFRTFLINSNNKKFKKIENFLRASFMEELELEFLRF
jgi:hypothetical protein